MADIACTLLKINIYSEGGEWSTCPIGFSTVTGRGEKPACSMAGWFFTSPLNT